jgi:spermidine synthase
LAATERLFEKLTGSSGMYFDGVRLESLQTPFQLIEVYETPDFGKLMRIDGANMTSELDEFFYHENLVHPAALAHPAPKQVLVIGGGDGGSVEELLKHPSVERVLLAELDAGVIDIAKRHLAAVHHGALDNARVEIRIGDGMALVRDTTERFDLIYLDLTDPGGPAEALYSAAFFADCQRALAAEGALVLHIGSPFSHAGRVRSSLNNLRAVFPKAAAWFVHIPAYGATWGFACASSSVDPASLSAQEIVSRLRERNIGYLQIYNADTHAGMFAQPAYLRRLIAR